MNVILNKLKNNLKHVSKNLLTKHKLSEKGKKILFKFVVNFIKHILQKNSLKQHECRHVQVVQRLRFSSVLVTSDSNSEGICLIYLVNKYNKRIQ